MSNNKKVIKKVFDFELKGTEKQLKEMYDLWNREDFYNPKFKKYFLCWVNYGTGIYAFPRKQYFVSIDGNTNWEEEYNKRHNDDSCDKWD